MFLLYIHSALGMFTKNLKKKLNNSFLFWHIRVLGLLPVLGLKVSFLFHHTLAGGSVVGMTSFVYYQNHVTVTPYTGRRRFMLLTSNQLFSMSQQLYEMVSDAGLITSWNIIELYEGNICHLYYL